MLRAGHPTLTPKAKIQMGGGGAISQCSDQPECCLTPLVPILPLNETGTSLTSVNVIFAKTSG